MYLKIESMKGDKCHNLMGWLIRDSVLLSQFMSRSAGLVDNIVNLQISFSGFEPPHDKTQQNDLCAQRRLRSAWASAQSDQSLRCALNWVAKAQSFLHADSKESYQTGQIPRLI